MPSVANPFFKSLFFSLFFSMLAPLAFGQDYPFYGPQKQVTISGLNFDAMEPFISPDGNYLLFNNLNDGINTKLFYATKVNDTTFNLAGELSGANQISPPHLDAVADLDSLNNFYWTSTREYPAEFDNLFHGKFNSGSIADIGRVHGDFYINTPGWLIMDHGISYDGQLLYFNNARFDGANCTGPCETRIGIARKVNDSTFNTLPNSTEILQNINDTDYIYYAPCITADNLELYYTRYMKGSITSSTVFEICVAVRDTPTAPFSFPQVLFSEVIANIIEAPTLSHDKQIMYYHKKIEGTHKIMLRYRETITGLKQAGQAQKTLRIIPNPMRADAVISFENTSKVPVTIVLSDHLGRTVSIANNVPSNRIEIKKENLHPGIYLVMVYAESKVIATGKLLIE